MAGGVDRCGSVWTEGWCLTNRVIGFSSSEYLTNEHPETTTTGFNLVPGT